MPKYKSNTHRTSIASTAIKSVYRDTHTHTHGLVSIIYLYSVLMQHLFQCENAKLYRTVLCDHQFSPSSPSSSSYSGPLSMERKKARSVGTVINLVTSQDFSFLHTFLNEGHIKRNT